MPKQPVIRAFFDEPTNTVSYLVADPAAKKAAIIDPVLDYDPNDGTADTRSVAAMLQAAGEAGYAVEWVLETHAHADHLSAAPYIQERLGGRLAIGRDIIRVQNVFGKLFNPASVTGYPAVPDGYLIGSAHTCPSPVHRNGSRPVARRGANSCYDMYNK